MEDYHRYYAGREKTHHPLRRLPLIGGSLFAAALVFVWSTGEVVGGMSHGSWPAVSLTDSAAELVQLCQHPGDAVAPGIPGGSAYFTVLTLLVVTSGVVAMWLLRLVRRPRVYWAPPRIMSRTSYQPFLHVYRGGRARRWR